MATPEARPFVRGNSSGGPFAADSSCTGGCSGGPSGCGGGDNCDFKPGDKDLPSTTEQKPAEPKPI